MKRFVTILLCCLLVLAAHAGKDGLVTHSYKDVSMAEALRQLGKESRGRYVINFMYDELEDFRVTTRVKKQPVPDAIRQMIGHYPISMTIEGDSAIYVECFLKEPSRFKGIVVDETGKPLEFANVTLLSPVDSTMLGSGVTTASGRFVIPYNPQPLIVRVTYVGYKPAYRWCHSDEAGTIRMELDEYALSNLTVTGTKENKEKKPKKTHRKKRQGEHVIFTLKDGTVVDGYLVSDIQGTKIRIARNGLNPKSYKVQDIVSLVFPNANGDTTAALYYVPVMVIDELAGDMRAKPRLLTKIYESDDLLGFTSPATDYKTYTTDSYVPSGDGKGPGHWNTHVHYVPFTTRQYYYQVKGNGIALPYWLMSWSGSKWSIKHHIGKVFRHFPSIISTVNGNEFDSKEFFEHPEALLPILDQALQQGDYQAVIVGEDQRAGRAQVVKRVFEGMGSLYGIALLLVLLK